MFRIEESLLVEAHPHGTKLTHVFRCAGLVSRLPHRAMQRNLAGILKTIDRALALRVDGG